MEKKEPIFADGIMFQRPQEGAPEWVRGKMSFNIAKLIAFLKSQREAGNISAKGWLNLDLKESKGGSLYFQVNTWKSPETRSVDEIKGQIGSSLSPGESEEIRSRRDAHNKAKDDFNSFGDEINPQDIPFD